MSNNHLAIIDPLAESWGHLIQDDEFLVNLFLKLYPQVTLFSSPSSIANLKSKYLPNLKMVPTRFHGAITKLWNRLIFILRMLTIKLPDDISEILIQSFEEVSVLFFMLFHTNLPISLIITNNIGNVHNKPLKRYFLSQIFRYSHSIFIHCNYERMMILKLFPKIDPIKIKRVRFHQISIPRETASFIERKKIVSYIGMSRIDKGIETFWNFIKANPLDKVNYGLYGQYDKARYDVDSLTHSKLDTICGLIPNGLYYKLFIDSLYIILPYERAYEGKLSGIFCDSIATKTPVLAPKIEPFIEFFDRYGPMGYLFDFDDKYWYKKMHDLWNYEQYAVFQQNMQGAIKDNHPDRIAEDFLS
jgi:hypothetical protein